jgi:hypothetical protein
MIATVGFPRREGSAISLLPLQFHLVYTLESLHEYFVRVAFVVPSDASSTPPKLRQFIESRTPLLVTYFSVK